MGEIQRARHEERVLSFNALSRHSFLPKSPRVYQPRSSPSPVLLGFMETSLHKHNWSNHWPLAIIPPPAHLPSSEVSGGTEISNPLIVWLLPLTISSHPWVFSNSHLINVRKDTLITLNTSEIPRVRGVLSWEQDQIYVWEIYLVIWMTKYIYIFKL